MSAKIFNCPYSPTLFGVKSRYTYNPQTSVFFFDEGMIGDTAVIHIQIKYMGAIELMMFMLVVDWD